MHSLSPNLEELDHLGLNTSLLLGWDNNWSHIEGRNGSGVLFDAHRCHTTAFVVVGISMIVAIIVGRGLLGTGATGILALTIVQLLLMMMLLLMLSLTFLLTSRNMRNNHQLNKRQEHNQYLVGLETWRFGVGVGGSHRSLVIAGSSRCASSSSSTTLHNILVLGSQRTLVVALLLAGQLLDLIFRIDRNRRYRNDVGGDAVVITESNRRTGSTSRGVRSAQQSEVAECRRQQSKRLSQQRTVHFRVGSEGGWETVSTNQPG